MTEQALSQFHAQKERPMDTDERSDPSGLERFLDLAARYPVEHAIEVDLWMRSAGYDPAVYGEYERWLKDYRLPHEFRPVAGHRDDDECTDRADGTDATYCGMPERLHDIIREVVG